MSAHVVLCSIGSQREGGSPVARQVLPQEVNDPVILHHGPGPQGIHTPTQTPTHTSFCIDKHLAKLLAYWQMHNWHWLQQATISRPLVYLLSLSLALIPVKVLLIGKSINFLHQVCHDRTPPGKITPVSKSADTPKDGKGVEFLFHGVSHSVYIYVY